MILSIMSHDIPIHCRALPHSFSCIIRGQIFDCTIDCALCSLIVPKKLTKQAIDFIPAVDLRTYEFRSDIVS
jgi:hypothetical protein